MPLISDTGSLREAWSDLGLQLEEPFVQGLRCRCGGRPELVVEESAKPVQDLQRFGLVALRHEHLHQQPVARRVRKFRRPRIRG
jgi:hypothetical protein